jgi:hypothetical protein
MTTVNVQRGQSNRRKGRVWELECEHYVKAEGWPKAKRQRFTHSGDLLGVGDICLECKNTTWQNIPAALDQAERDAAELHAIRGVVIKKRGGHRDVGAGLWVGRVGAELATARASGWRVATTTDAIAAPVGGHPDPGAARAVDSAVLSFTRSILAVCQYIPWEGVPEALDAARAYASSGRPGVFSRVVLIKRQRGNDDPAAGYWIGTVGAELAAERDRQGSGGIGARRPARSLGSMLRP